MRVLFLSYTAGQGHNMTCRAMISYLKPLGVQCLMLDAIDCIDPSLCKFVDATYTNMAKYTPKMWGEIYRLCEKTSTDKSDPFLLTLNRMLAKRLIRTVNSFAPDAVVCSHVYGGHVIQAMRKVGLLSPQTVTYGIVTDFTIHPYWEAVQMDHLVLASPFLVYAAEKRGILAETLMPIGIPVDPKFTRAGDKTAARRALGLEDKPTFFLMAGSIGMNPLFEAVKALAALPNDLQLITVCGRNNRLRERIDSLQSSRILNLGFVNNVDQLMDASDWVITKPGGLSTSEALAKNLPMLLIDPIPGVEDYNLDFLVNMGMAMHCRDLKLVDSMVRTILNCPERADDIRDAQKRYAPHDSAKTLGDFIISHSRAQIST